MRQSDYAQPSMATPQLATRLNARGSLPPGAPENDIAAC
jgi:hypothetical protein